LPLRRRWYEERREGLGLELLAEVDAVFEAIARRPGRIGKQQQRGVHAGPLQGGMVDDFIERKWERRAVAYDLPELRELLEETGLKASRWTEIQRMHLSNSVSDELSIIYLARDLAQFEAEPEDTEQLIIKKIPFAEMYRMVCDGEITDSMTVAAVLKVQLLLLENRL